MRTVVVLVVDDDKSSRSLLELALSTEGYDVRSAANGAAGLDGARRLHPDVILLDLTMPIMDGFAFRAAQLLDPAIAGIPVICISGREDSKDAVRDLKLAGSAGKPFALDDVVFQVRDLTRRRATPIM
jgi:DNA-binding response OmpR family regulator